MGAIFQEKLTAPLFMFYQYLSIKRGSFCFHILIKVFSYLVLFMRIYIFNLDSYLLVPLV